MAATFSPTAAESALVAQIFSVADTNKLGALTGDVAVKVFGGANLSPLVLGEIWQMADEANNGWLSTKGVAMAVRLMGHAQQGTKISTALLSKPGPLPTIAGITPLAPQSTGSSASRARSPQPSLPPFTPQDKIKFQNMFAKSGPVDGLLSGDKAQDVFLKSKLPHETLGLIWNLADTQDRGKLDSTDFAIGMYFIQAVMTGQISTIPNSLPPGFYQQVAGVPIRQQATGGTYSPLASTFSQRSTIQPQYTGASQNMLQPQTTGPWSTKQPVPPHLPARPAVSAPASGASLIGSGAFGTSQPHWDISPAEKATSDRWFDTLDTQKRGYIQDDVAVPFMLESKLSGEDLAQIWDLADINNNGQLTRDGFAIAWYLIQKKRVGVPIPATLPPSLIPPSMRGGAAPAPAPQAASELPKDLFSWDDPLPAPQQPAPAPTPAPFPTAQHLTPQPTSTLSPQHTAFSSPPPPAADLLGDDEDTAAPLPQDRSAEIGNLQNQVNSTSKSLAAAQAERQALETTLANQAAQLSALETQLSTAKAAFETENKLLAGLRERHATQTAEIQKTQTELISAESDLSAIKVEKAEIEGAFLRDKEEARTLHKKMVEAGQQIELAKVEVERSKKEAKQQKGLLAIARKQLSSKEAERAKMEKELADAQAEAANIVAEKGQIEASIAALDAQPLPAAAPAPPPERTTSSDSLAFAAAHILPASPALDAISPSIASSIKSNNPFDRLMGNATPRSESPFAPTSNPVSPEPVPEPAAAPAADPFGFAQAFETDGTEPAETPTPKPELVAATNDLTVDEPVSDSDVFSTPLTASTPAFPAIDDVVAGEAQRTKSPELAASADGETDLGAQLKELDVEESDSSDSEDEDEVPLGTLKAKAEAEAEAEAAAVEVPKTNGDAKSANFDDVFGVPETAPEPTPAVAAPAPADPLTDAFGMPIATTNGFSPSAPVAGVNAFDEAMGKLPATDAPATFNAFDSAFDDNFDFGAASSGPAAVSSGSSFPPPPSANGHAVSPLPPSATKNEFDNIFAPATGTSEPAKAASSNGIEEVAWTAPALAPQPATPVATNGVNKSAAGPSFEEAFSGFDSGVDTNNLSASLDKPATPAPATTAAAAAQPFPVSSPAASPKSSAQSHTASRRSMSPPPRHRSPPPPTRSGTKGRPSTSSSKDEKVKEKEKDHPPRSSKLSIRLPFGKKKNKNAEPLPSAPSSHLTPPQEEGPLRTPTPAVDDDVEAVKQLTAMGFSRSQAVESLEVHGYDVSKALNSLLGQ
ncbi:hypothetical protein HMN09_00045900 [Mycena chlorophos]|uniref:Uncharacterized protein n=1 Tax=Mycena chlorophos TaxID=658473 RepID=A0A8H6TTR1_MYCCL|nr:hypothetical protein HMN09_00045900 [Mycena chlorophos]